jgi:hypothetical protein
MRVVVGDRFERAATRADFEHGVAHGLQHARPTIGEPLARHDQLGLVASHAPARPARE